jgi:hypothetical protein
MSKIEMEWVGGWVDGWMAEWLNEHSSSDGIVKKKYFFLSPLKNKIHSCIKTHST